MAETVSHPSPEDPLAPPPPPRAQRLNHGVLLAAAAIAALTVAVAFLATPRQVQRPAEAVRPLASGNPAFLDRPPAPLPPQRPLTPSEQEYLRAIQALSPQGAAGAAGAAGGAGTAGFGAVPGALPGSLPGQAAGTGGMPAAPGASAPAGSGAEAVAAQLDPRAQAFARALRAPLTAGGSAPAPERAESLLPIPMPSFAASGNGAATLAARAAGGAAADAREAGGFAGLDGGPQAAAGGDGARRAAGAKVPDAATPATAPSAGSTAMAAAYPRQPATGGEVPAAARAVVAAGTVIPALLLTEVNSDVPGPLLAQVSRDVYDASGAVVAIPRGTRLLGSYQNQVAVGQSRLVVAWTRLQAPDGATVELPGLPGTDPGGAAGITARVESHVLRLFGDALLLSLLAAGADLSQPAQRELTLAPTAGSVASAAVGQQLADVGTQLLRRDVSIQPTLRLPAGTALAIFVNGDLPVPVADHER
jgi:type IV secretion system protein TrbI